MCLGIPGQITEIVDPDKHQAIVDVAGIRRPVNIVCIVSDEHPLHACVGDWVLVHVGFAMSRIDAQEASKTMALLAELGEVQEQLTAMQTSA